MSMKAYYKDKHIGEPKFIAERFDGVPGTSKANTKGAKEEARNANRSRKKSYRQEIKNELRDFLKK